MSELIDVMCDVARAAGAAILDIYQEDDFGIETKSDDSPLTRADLAAHQLIVSRLNEAVPSIPVLSEESGPDVMAQRRQWTTFFMVDPLDGTKEFINRNGEFTVNIALIDDGVPVKGVVYVPVKDVMYRGDQSTGEASVERDGVVQRIETRALNAAAPLTVVASRRHGGEALESCLTVLKTRFDNIETTNMGSSLKLCLVAEGAADLYPRLAPTSEWDTAAAQAVVEAAGGQVVDIDLNVLRYNQRDEILNPFFYVLGDPAYDWRGLLKQVSI
ncbi:MAG: 3'(2'), 5'-bisphosphate nucleotidase [Candidatus Azotimanducaceae bacterium]|jgi:3'(2'), 5'-bisphosphate nucleotidase